MDGKSRVGLIGLGNAGLALAQPLLKRFEVMGFDLDEGRRGIAGLRRSRLWNRLRLCHERDAPRSPSGPTDTETGRRPLRNRGWGINSDHERNAGHTSFPASLEDRE